MFSIFYPGKQGIVVCLSKKVTQTPAKQYWQNIYWLSYNQDIHLNTYNVTHHYFLYETQILTPWLPRKTSRLYITVTFSLRVASSIILCDRHGSRCNVDVVKLSYNVVFMHVPSWLRLVIHLIILARLVSKSITRRRWGSLKGMTPKNNTVTSRYMWVTLTLNKIYCSW